MTITKITFSPTLDGQWRGVIRTRYSSIEVTGPALDGVMDDIKRLARNE